MGACISARRKPVYLGEDHQTGREERKVAAPVDPRAEVIELGFLNPDTGRQLTNPGVPQPPKPAHTSGSKPLAVS